MDLDKNVFDECNLQKSAPLLCNETVRMFCCVVTRTGYRPPSKLGINPHHEKLNEKVACGLRASHTETKHQKEKHPNFSSDAFLFGEADDAMSELFAIFSISSVVGISIGLSSNVRNTLI